MLQNPENFKLIRPTDRFRKVLLAFSKLKRKTVNMAPEVKKNTLETQTLFLLMVKNSNSAI